LLDLARDLRAAGVTVWLDEAELGIGDSLVAKVGQAIDATDFLGVLLCSSTKRVSQPGVLDGSPSPLGQ
jgi:TIR domain